MGGGGGSRVTAAAGGRAILFRLNYTVTQGGQRRNSTNERGRKKIQAVKEGLAPTVGKGMNMERSQTWVR